MRIGEDFGQLENMGSGELIIKLPGTDFVMPYETGIAFLSDSGIGYVSLAVEDFFTRENGEPEGLCGIMGRQLAKQLEYPAVKALTRKAISESELNLFYSRSPDNIEIFTIPGMSGEYGIDEQATPNSVVATYPLGKITPSVEEVYSHHKKAVGRRELITDRGVLEKDILNLVDKVNGIYDLEKENMMSFSISIKQRMR